MSYINLPPLDLGSVGIAELTPELGGAAAAAGEIGEIIESSVGAPTAVGVGGTGTWGAVTNIVLSAGVWRLTAVAGFRANGALLADHMSVGITNSATGVGISLFDYTQYNHTTTNEDFIGNGTPILINIAVGDTYYLNTRFVYSAGSPQHYGKITARRYR